MRDRFFRPRLTLRQKWHRRQHWPSQEERLRAGVAGAYLPRLLLDVPHEPQVRVSDALPRCAAMVLRSFGDATTAEEIASVLGADEEGRTPGARLAWLRPYGYDVRFPDQLQRFRDGTVELNRRLPPGSPRMFYQWEERWLRYVRRALEDGIPPILFVDLGRLHPQWLGLGQPHAVVLCGGDGRRAWINDPARVDGPTRVGLSTLMDALMPFEPLAGLLSPRSAVTGPRSEGNRGR